MRYSFYALYMIIHELSHYKHIDSDLEQYFIFWSVDFLKSFLGTIINLVQYGFIVVLYLLFI